MQTKPLYYVIAGEKSGDLHGGELIHALKEQMPRALFKGVGGQNMQSEGLVSIVPFKDFQVMGFSDVFLALPRLVRHFYTLVKTILQDSPCQVIFVDYPGFNLRLAKHLRKKGYKGKLIHYIAPSVWAWKKKRIQIMAKTLDLLLTIYPFEPKYFEKTGLKTVYVGNSLTKGLKDFSFSRNQVLALFPGSRIKEVERNLPIQAKAACYFLEKNPSWSVVISVGHPDLEPFIHHLLKDIPIPYLLASEIERYALMEKCHLSLAKSGTVTLELGLRGCPTVVMYSLSYLNFFLAKYIFRISLPYFSLPNLLLNESFFPEFYHARIDPKALAAALNQEKENHFFAIKKAKQLRKLLSDKDASKEAVKEILSIC